MPKVKITQELGISLGTLHRQDRVSKFRFINKEVYSAEFAQSKYDKAHKGKEGELKIEKNLMLIRYLEYPLKHREFLCILH